MTRRIRVKKPCSAPGCPALVEKGTCPEHTTDEPRYRGSTQRRWRAISKAHRAAEPRCDCGKPSTVTDHVIPLGVPAPLYDCATCGHKHRELATRCHGCHRRKTQAEDVLPRPSW